MVLMQRRLLQLFYPMEFGSLFLRGGKKMALEEAYWAHLLRIANFLQEVLKLSGCRQNHSWGILKLAPETGFGSRLKSTLEKHKVLQRFLLVLALIGAGMVIGDGVLTPAISGKVYETLFFWVLIQT
ncbi:hypothetical protein I3843_11G077100 [Carya illinoinensis]|uniref:K+ potassium transporter integral membrane domain-containing protein n=1 Tax=Carya illinoinensis TaxID=32201 RepID=A0A922IYE3_CARIL|nr:hypothetical protein I3842_11G077300 [Carya illinoinensis]KAG7955526.1 hypothetical protein I3843_11G077100 [Carya illinoinensis]